MKNMQSYLLSPSCAQHVTTKNRQLSLT